MPFNINVIDYSKVINSNKSYSVIIVNLHWMLLDKPIISVDGLFFEILFLLQYLG